MSEEKNIETEIVQLDSGNHVYEIPVMPTYYGIAFGLEYDVAVLGEKGSVEDVMAEIQSYDPEKIFAICASLLPGAKIDDEVCSDGGLCELFRKQPREIYEAILFGLIANFPDYFPFLLEGPGTEESPSPQ